MHRLHWLSLAVLLFTTGTAHANAGARLLLVQKNGHAALFLPESHIGSPAQDDAYFRNVIRPAFAASSVLMAERSSLSWFDREYYQAGCPGEGAAEAVFDQALAQAAREDAPPVPPVLQAFFPANWTESLGRFMRFQLVFRKTALITPGQSNEATITVRNAQSSVLMTEAPRRHASVEDLGTWLHAYCALTPAERASLIGATLKERTTPDDNHDPDHSAEHRRAVAYRAVNEQYRQALDNLRADLRGGRGGNANFTRRWTAEQMAANKFLLAQRSQAWVDGLPAVLQREHLPFYALGAAHFADAPYGPGLITLLRRAGYKVTLISDRRMLDTALARLPPASPEQPAAAPAAPPPDIGTGRALPHGWLPLLKPSLRGSFLKDGSNDVAILMQNGATDGVVVIPDKASGEKVSIVRTFDASESNPPRLSLIQPGSYAPVCHGGGACTPVGITTEAIGLCHGEASCEILYYKDGAFHHLPATD